MIDGSDAEPGLLVDEEVEDAPGLIEAAESDDLPDPTGETPTAGKDDLDPLAESDDLEVEDLPTEQATAAAAAAAAAPTEEPKKTLATAEPFTYKGDKGEHTLDGAQYYAGDGLYIPEAQIPKLKQQLAAAAVHNGSWQREKRESDRALAEARTGRNEKDVAADALMDLVFKDLGTLETDDEVYDWAVNFRRNLPETRAAIREKRLEHRERQLEAKSQPSPEEVEDTHNSTAATALEQTLVEIFARPDMKVLDAEDQKELRERFSARARQYLTVSDRDDPQYELKKGDYIFDGAALLDQIQIAAGIKSRSVTASNAAAAAAAANRRKLGTVPARSTATRTAVAVPTGEPAVPRDSTTGRFKSRAQYDEWMRSDAE